MKFQFEKFLSSRENVICVDGSFDAKLQLSHWYGNKSPVELKADTTTQMAFNLIEHKDKEKYLHGIKIVSNNHYDADGVLSAFVLLNPELSLKHKTSLINISITGDFSEFTTEDALKANIIIESFADENKSDFKDIFSKEDYPTAIQFIYERTFELLPKIITQIDEFENIWLEEYNYFEKSEKSFGVRESVVSNYDDCNLSVIESNFPLHSVAKFMNADNDILLSVVRSSQGNTYELEYKYYTWFDTLRPKKIKRKNFESLAQKLNQIELNTRGFWQIIGNSPILDWNYRLIYADKNLNLVPSGLKVFEIENILFEHL